MNRNYATFIAMGACVCGAVVSTIYWGEIQFERGYKRACAKCSADIGGLIEFVEKLKDRTENSNED